MTFSALKQVQASKKFLMVRLKPARYVNDDLTLVSGLDYTMSFPYDVADVQENGSTVTYTYNESTEVLNVTLTGAPSSSNIVIVYYYIYYTGERVRTVGKNPESPTTDLRDWEPRLKSTPQFSQSIENILNGVLSISSSSLTLINNDSEFEQYLTGNDSFYNKQVEIWQCLDDITNIQKVFNGVVTGVNVDRKTVNIGLKDNLASLNVPCLMGDDEVYFTNDHFTAVDPNKDGFPVRYIIGTASRYKLHPETVTNLTTAQHLDVSSLNEAVCTNFTTDLTTSNNREYGCCRVSSNGFENFGFTPSNIDNTDPNFTRLDGTAAQVAKFNIGDTFVVSGSGTYYCRTLYVDRTNNYVYVTKQAGMITTDVVNSNDCPAISIDDGVNAYHCLYGRDYTATVSALASGNKYLKIDFVNNFEASHALTVLDPQTMTVGYRVKPSQANQKHGTVLKSILDKAGLTTNAASFSSADTAFAVNANFSIPYFDESDYGEYYSYVELLLQSTLGYILLNNSFEIAYNLFDTPSSSTAITDTDIIENTYKIAIDYNDIVTQVVAYNPHYSNSEFNSVSSATGSSLKAEHLHGVRVTTRFRHVLEDYSSKITDVINIRSERFARYSMVTKSLNYDSILGDDILLSKNGILGNDSTKSVTLLRLDKKTNETGITASDLYNL